MTSQKLADQATRQKEKTSKRKTVSNGKSRHDKHASHLGQISDQGEKRKEIARGSRFNVFEDLEALKWKLNKVPSPLNHPNWWAQPIRMGNPGILLKD